MSKADYERYLPEAQAFSLGVNPPFMQVSRFIQKANTVRKLAMDNKDRFLKKNFDWTLVEKIEDVCGALRHAESMCSVVFPKMEDQRKWEEAEDRAFELRGKIQSAFRYAFRAHPELLEKLRKINVGDDQADSIQDMSDYAMLGKENIDLLKAVNFDIGCLDEAEASGKSLSSLLANATVNREGTGPQYEIRNRFFSLIKWITDEIESCADYVFEDDPETAAKFKIRYEPRTRRKKESSAVAG